MATTTKLTCDNCDDSGFFIGRSGLLSTYCRKTGNPIPDYIALPTCNKHSKFALLEKGGVR
ncbi:MAG: hypothetical protein IJ057_06550 [Bacteroidales bacterium]|nr:hypothetical protein [Bacteroidales bacterium]